MGDMQKNEPHPDDYWILVLLNKPSFLGVGGRLLLEVLD
jgi:hypothetical protein